MHRAGAVTQPSWNMFKGSNNFCKSSIHWQVQAFEYIFVLGTSVNTMYCYFHNEKWLQCGSLLLYWYTVKPAEFKSLPGREPTASWISKTLYFCSVMVDKACRCSTKTLLKFSLNCRWVFWYKTCTFQVVLSAHSCSKSCRGGSRNLACWFVWINRFSCS